MPARTCVVSFTDIDGIVHSVEVMASSLYEAAALALQAFRSAELIEANPGRGTRFHVMAKAPATAHELTVGKLEDWLSRSGSPKEVIEKKRLQELLKQA